MQDVYMQLLSMRIILSTLCGNPMLSREHIQSDKFCYSIQFMFSIPAIKHDERVRMIQLV